MKKLALISGIILVSFMVLVQSGIVNAALVFVLTGVIPSTNYSVPPIAMFVLMAMGLWLVFAAASQDWLRKNIDHAHAKHLHQTVSLPRRRYGKMKIS